ncbi:hypothetical protein BA78_8356 [Aspergillus fumigatus]|nr:hypothetical protein BA78_8356 [Aspergillus fumigatus]
MFSNAKKLVWLSEEVAQHKVRGRHQASDTEGQKIQNTKAQTPLRTKATAVNIALVNFLGQHPGPTPGTEEPMVASVLASMITDFGNIYGNNMSIAKKLNVSDCEQNIPDCRLQGGAWKYEHVSFEPA